MFNETVKTELKRYLPRYLEEECGIAYQDLKHHCCINPNHNDTNPSAGLVDNGTEPPIYNCFSCGLRGDLYKVIEIREGLKGKAIFDRALELYGGEIDGDLYTPSAGDVFGTNQPNKEPTPQSSDIQKAPQPYTEEQEQKALESDHTEVIKLWHQALLKNPKWLEYLASRGIDREHINKYQIGLDENERDNKIVLPYWVDGKSVYYVKETPLEIRQNNAFLGYKYSKYKKIPGAKEPIWNEGYIREPPNTLFVCEGVYDALSVEEMGGHAMALVGVSTGRLLGLCAKYKPNTTFILSLDNDAYNGNGAKDQGQNANKHLADGLKALGLRYIERIPPSHKDFNEWLIKDREGFGAWVKKTIAEGEKALTDETRAYLDTSATNRLDNFNPATKRLESMNCYKTGFNGLDDLLGGGLYPGLYFLGAITSLGKTAICMQIMDHIASTGNDVLIFSLEMAQDELIARSISRHTYTESMKATGDKTHAKTTRGILNGGLYKHYNQAETDTINNAIASYKAYSDHIYIREGVGNIGVDEIRTAIQTHIKYTGCKPVVLVDYVQILAPVNERYTDKMNIDKSVLELKRITRDMDIPLLGISSFNRESYIAPVSLSAFKESGAIEYTCDALLGLQYYGMDYRAEKKEERTARVNALISEQQTLGKEGKAQIIQLKVLKNRNGSKGSVNLDYWPKFNYLTVSKTQASRRPTEPNPNYTGSKRTKERNRIRGAYFLTRDADSKTTTARKIARALDIKRTGTVINAIKEHGDFIAEQVGDEYIISVADVPGFAPVEKDKEFYKSLLE